MSSCPGGYLEDFLKWQLDLTVIDTSEANISLGYAEALGLSTRVRSQLTKEEFAPIVEMFEQYREDIERRLDDFNEDEQSWRGYAEYVDCDVPKELYDKVQEYIKGLDKPKE